MQKYLSSCIKVCDTILNLDLSVPHLSPGVFVCILLISISSSDGVLVTWYQGHCLVLGRGSLKV